MVWPTLGSRTAKEHNRTVNILDEAVRRSVTSAEQAQRVGLGVGHAGASILNDARCVVEISGWGEKIARNSV